MTVDAILVDDDQLTRLAWKVRAKQAGKAIEVFANEQQLVSFVFGLSGVSEIPLETPIYVDLLLGDNVRGEEICRRLSEKKFSHLILTTGLDPETVSHPPYVLKVIGKSPPW